MKNKFQKAMQDIGCSVEKYEFVSWTEQVESCPEYQQGYSYVKNLYQENDQFRVDIQQATEAALKSMKNADAGDSHLESIDVEEGVEYLLKELAWLDALPNIFENCKQYVDVYHRGSQLLEKYFEGFYDGLYRPYFGSVIYE